MSDKIEKKHTSSITLVNHRNIKNFTTSDFAVESPAHIAIKHRKCKIVLFHTENNDSMHLLEIFVNVSDAVPGNKYAAVNLNVEKKVFDAFDQLKNEPNNPLYYYSLINIPVIFAYREGFPQAIYNGDLSVKAISNWVLVLACNASYHENQKLYSTVNVDQNMKMSQNLKRKFIITTSTQFVDEDENVSKKDDSKNPENAPGNYVEEY